MAEQFEFFWSGPFSQWYPSVFIIGQFQYSCAEQYMMAEKARLFGDKIMEEAIMDTADPAAQKQYGRQVANFDDKTWKAHARDIVKQGSMAKYSQNPHLLKTLLATGTKTIVEASPEDRVWGIGLRKTDPRAQRRETWRGTNWLGQVLTEVRDELRAAKS